MRKILVMLRSILVMVALSVLLSAAAQAKGGGITWGPTRAGLRLSMGLLTIDSARAVEIRIFLENQRSAPVRYFHRYTCSGFSQFWLTLVGSDGHSTTVNLGNDVVCTRNIGLPKTIAPSSTVSFTIRKKMPLLAPDHYRIRGHLRLSFVNGSKPLDLETIELQRASTGLDFRLEATRSQPNQVTFVVHNRWRAPIELADRYSCSGHSLFAVRMLGPGLDRRVWLGERRPCRRDALLFRTIQPGATLRLTIRHAQIRLDRSVQTLTGEITVRLSKPRSLGATRHTPELRL